MLTDSHSLLDSIESSRQIDDQLMRLVIKWMKQMLDARMISSVRWVDTEVCLVDILTKTSFPLIEDLMEILRTGNMINLSYSRK